MVHENQFLFSIHNKVFSIGLRPGFLSSGKKIHQGHRLKIMIVFQGIVIHLVVVMSGEEVRNKTFNSKIISGGITIGFM
ncbi:MAG: hypothetical protein CMF83_00685 [Candidatus Marinimicrobia bacterium]|nr:hypothetical protein [Candidatus Neomarinimicrobiota bacterium]